MIVKDHIPIAPLRPYIKSYKIIESREDIINRVLPNTSITIAFRVRGNLGYRIDNHTERLPMVTISGLRKSARLIQYCDDAKSIVVLFKETGASAFFRESLYALFGESVSLDNFIPHDRMSTLEEKLATFRDSQQQIDIIEQFFLAQLSNHHSDTLIRSAIDTIYLVKGNIKMKELVTSLSISDDAFEKRFRKIVGTSPKHFSSIVRMTSLIKQKRPDQSLMDLAFDAGYYDQAHFNKDFKLFTGQVPTVFFKSSSLW